jgi:hypothetical protein
MSAGDEALSVSLHAGDDRRLRGPIPRNPCAAVHMGPVYLLSGRPYRITTAYVAPAKRPFPANLVFINLLWMP